jgi:hypothetical protein
MKFSVVEMSITPAYWPESVSLIAANVVSLGVNEARCLGRLCVVSILEIVVSSSVSCIEGFAAAFRLTSGKAFFMFLPLMMSAFRLRSHCGLGRCAKACFQAQSNGTPMKVVRPQTSAEVFLRFLSTINMHLLRSRTILQIQSRSSEVLL